MVERVTVMNTSEIGAFLSARRKQLGLSQKRVAKNIDVLLKRAGTGDCTKQVGNWECGRSNPTLRSACAWAAALGVKLTLE